MSDAIQSRKSTLRNELYAVFGDRPRLIKAFENLLADVSTNLPADISSASDESDAATLQAVNIATAQTQQLRARIDALSDGPPPPVPLIVDADDVAPLLNQLLARVWRLELELANLKEGPTP